MEAEGQLKVEWISIERMMRDVRELLLPQIPADVHAVAGVPRSGMAAATYLATVLHLPLLQVGACGLLPIAGGARTRSYEWPANRIGATLVVEDSIFDGKSLDRARRLVKHGLFVAVYSRASAKYSPDLFARELDSPHIFEWHFFNSGYMNGRVTHPAFKSGAALDMDGIICEEPQAPDHPQDNYERWLIHARPRWLPRSAPCRAIITGRLEVYRRQTQEWLQRWGVKYEELIMMPVRNSPIAEWKARVLKNMPRQPSVFVESSPKQSEIIRRHWRNGVVICPSEHA